MKMKKLFIIIIFCLAVITFPNQTIGAGQSPEPRFLDNRLLDNQEPQPEWPEDARSTTGPTPPAGIDRGELSLLFPDTQVVLDVPAYIWYNGCGPTAAGMVLGYWDGQGYDNLVPGDASTQTPAVDNMISSTGNYNDYCLPLDYYPDPLLPDKSEPPAGDEHADDSVADFMNTSQSASSLYYGWSWNYDIDNAFTGYVSSATPEYFASATNQPWGTFTWNSFRAEIDAGRPVVLLVDTDADGFTDHFVPAIGYSDDGGTNQYACRDTWDTGIHWFDFAQMAPGQPWGIFDATTFQISGSLPGSFSKTSPSNGATNQPPNPTLSWGSSSDATSYEYCIDTINNNACDGSWTNVGMNTSAPLSGLSMGTIHYWQVRARNASGFTEANSQVWWQFTDFTDFIYLPLINSNQAPLYGTVTDLGFPVVGTTLELRYHNGTSWSTFDTTTTDSNGDYTFTNLPVLDTGKQYYVKWENNDDNSDRLAGWWCYSIEPSTTDPNANRCNFDLENIALLTPDPGETVELPQNFTWQRRMLTNDDYEFNLLDPSDGDPWWWTTPTLGYVGNYTLDSLPSGFFNNVAYGWLMYVYGPDGFGLSYYYRTITFSNSGSSPINTSTPLNKRFSQDGLGDLFPADFPQAEN
jgi:hypothetical protein